MNFVCKQGQSVTITITLDTVTTAPLYLGIYSGDTRSQRLLLTVGSGLEQVSDKVYLARITPQQTKQMSGSYTMEILIGEPTGSVVSISAQPMTLQVSPSRIGREVVR
jgi:spore coat protein U-like protein